MSRCRLGSKEVIRRAQTRVWQHFLLARRWIELEEIILHEFVHFHDGCLVAASVAVVGCGENRHYVTLVRPVVAVHDQLMRAGNSSQVVGVVELLGDVLPERIASTSGRDAPTASVVRI